MSRFIAFITGKHVLAAFICLLLTVFLFQKGPYPALKEKLGQAPLPEEQPMALSAIHSHFDTLEATGRSMYITFQYLDFLNILVMLAFFSFFLAWLMKKLGKEDTRLRFLVLFPAVLASLDAFENIGLLALVTQYPEPSILGGLFPGLSTAKMVAFGMTALAMITLTIWAIIMRIRKPKAA